MTTVAPDAGGASRELTAAKRADTGGTLYPLPEVDRWGRTGLTGGDMTDRPTTELHDLPDKHRYVLEHDGAVAELVYRTEPRRLIIMHTEVPDALSGRGIGGRLVLAAVDRAAAESLTIVPWCPFARRWLRDHPDVADNVTVDWKTQPPSP